MKPQPFFIVIIAAFIYGCAAPKGSLSPNFNQISASHKDVAILPFYVSMQNPSRADDGQIKFNLMSEQERQGALDLQRDLFLYLAKQVQKGNITMRFQDFNRTNKTLSENGIKLDQISQIDKAKLANILGVDAVFWGMTAVNISRRSTMMGPSYRDGVESELRLFDARTGEMIWNTQSSQRPSSPMDTPHRLASNTLNSMARQVPYRVKK
jgi:PBP1b-binding outer membrane lipoprotein LpoB